MLCEADWSGDNERVSSISQLVINGETVDLARLAEICDPYGVAELSILGSMAQGEAGPGSDVDLLFMLKPDARLGFALFDLEDELREIFGCL